MSKRALSIATPQITLEPNARVPLHRQLYERLCAAILAGQLETGARLPSTRALASALGVSRTTTELVYELLLLEGYVESKVGDGTRVARLRLEHLIPPAQDGDEQRATHARAPQSLPLARRGQLLAATVSSDAFYRDQVGEETNVFRVGQPDVTAFPYRIWASLVGRHARQSLQAVSLYQDSHGYLPLRQAIATHIGITRAVRCTPDQIILTSGSQGALDLVARVLLDPGDSAWVEDPGYPGARGALLAAGARPVPVPVDREGLMVEAGQQAGPTARLAIVTPSHQFPTAVTMSLSRRLALLNWAREAHAWIVEDDYDSEFRFSGRPLEALQGLDGAEWVLYIGTFSKVLFPSLRLGYLIAPSTLLDGLLAARRLIDVHPPLLDQLALADFIAEGHFVRHLRKMRHIYLERRNALVSALTLELGDIMTVAAPEAGMHLAAWLPSHMGAQAVVGQAAEHGLHVSAISQFSLRPLQRDGLVFGFANASADALRAGVHTLAHTLGAGER